MYILYRNIVLLALWLWSVGSLDCDVSLRKESKLGLGVYADIDIEPGQTIETSIGIPIPVPTVYWTELVNYAEGYNSSHALLLLGNAMVYNHIENPDLEMIRKYMTYEDGILQFRGAFERSADIMFVAKRYVDKGEQILLHYGNDWFENRGKIVMETVPTVTERVKLFPGCPKAMIQLRNNKLISTRTINEGEVIEVARAILLPSWAIVADSPLVDLLWWKRTTAALNATDLISILNKNQADRETTAPLLGSAHRVSPWHQSNVDYAVLLTGNGALYSHSSVFQEFNESSKSGTLNSDTKLAITRDVPNVRYDWIEERDSATDVVAEPSIDPSLLPTCKLLRLVSFTASREIAPNEELVVDLVLNPYTNMRFASSKFSSRCL